MKSLHFLKSAAQSRKSPTFTADDLSRSGLSDFSVLDFREWISNASAHIRSRHNSSFNEDMNDKGTESKNKSNPLVTISRRQMRLQKWKQKLTATEDRLSRSLEEFENINREIVPKERNLQNVATEAYRVQNRKVASAVGGLVWSHDTDISECPQERKLNCLRFRHSVVGTIRPKNSNASAVTG